MTVDLSRQYAWSLQTFGPGSRTKGVVDHIRKECTELEESNGKDLSEWVDILILSSDGAMREGFTPEEIWAAWEHKNAVNRARKWPDWRTADPDKAIEHIRTPA